MRTTAQLEDQIAAIYRFWASQAPGVTPREEGALAKLWAELDRRYEQERVEARMFGAA